MENAGVQAAQQLTRTHAGAPRILFLCGKGNNGRGRPFVMARLLTLKGWAVSVSLALWGTAFRSSLSSTAAACRSRFDSPPDDSLYGEIARADLLVDAVFGIGFHGELPEPVRIVFREANASNAERIALIFPVESTAIPANKAPIPSALTRPLPSAPTNPPCCWIPANPSVAKSSVWISDCKAADSYSQRDHATSRTIEHSSLLCSKLTPSFQGAPFGVPKTFRSMLNRHVPPQQNEHIHRLQRWLLCDHALCHCVGTQ